MKSFPDFIFVEESGQGICCAKYWVVPILMDELLSYVCSFFQLYVKGDNDLERHKRRMILKFHHILPSFGFNL